MANCKTIGVRGQKLSLPIKIFFFSLSLFFLAVFILGGAELLMRKWIPPWQVARNVHPYYVLDMRCGIYLPPGLRYEEFGKKMEINSLGFRGPEISAEKKGARFAFLGDSYTEGIGVAEEDNFPSLTVRQLEKKHSLTIDYVNSGVGGSSPSQQHLIYNEKVKSLKPDVIVYALHDNDLGDDFAFAYSGYYAHVSIYRKIPKLLRHSRLAQRLAQIWIEKRRIGNEARYNALQKVMTEKEKWEKWTRPALDQLAAAAARDGAKLFLGYIPGTGALDGEYEEGKKGQGHPPFASWAKEWAESKRIPFLDLYPVFEKVNTPKANEIYLPAARGFHLNENGNRIFSRKLVEQIDRNLDWEKFKKEYK